jgi:hypothetical protein
MRALILSVGGGTTCWREYALDDVGDAATPGRAPAVSLTIDAIPIRQWKVLCNYGKFSSISQFAW